LSANGGRVETDRFEQDGRSSFLLIQEGEEKVGKPEGFGAKPFGPMSGAGDRALNSWAHLMHFASPH
jgi:hypothetical protein